MVRFPVLFPLACAIAGFVLVILALFAGSKPGHMEEYAIVRVGSQRENTMAGSSQIR
jgi:hypothetical protein